MTHQRALKLVRALGRAEAAIRGQEFLAPLLRGGGARMRIQGLIYRLTVADAQPGWWLCRVVDARTAEVVTEAMPWQRGDYLALWPTIQLVLLAPLERDAWLAMPQNLAAGQRLLGGAGPFVAHLVEGGQPFERVIGRVEGHAIWYDDLDHMADAATAEVLREAVAGENDLPRIKGLTDGEKLAYAFLFGQTRKGRLQRELQAQSNHVRAALAVGGAQLVGIEHAENGVRVTWERDGQRSVTMIDTRLNVVSSGICLSGEDARFDMTSIVGVVLDSPWYRGRG
jgi:hypothetical protein